MRQPIWEKVTKRAVSFGGGHKSSLITSFLAAFCAYTFAFTNKLMCADEVENLFSKGATLSSGRWGLEITRLIFPDVSMPWIYGIITICLISIACCYIIDIFSISNKALRALIPAVIITFPSLIGTFAYMFTSASYGLAFFTAVLAVFCLKEKRGVSAFFAMVFSLSIYQAYISVAASLLLLIIIQKLLLSTEDIQKIIKTGVEYVLFLGLSLVAYYLASMLIANVMGDGFGVYAAGNINTAKDSIILRPFKAYFFYIASILKGSFGLVQGKLGIIFHILLILAAAASILKWMLRNDHKIANKILLIICIVLIPLAVNSMFLFVNEHAIHTLVLYGFSMNYVIVAVIWESVSQTSGHSDSKMSTIQEDVIVLALTAIIVVNIFTANKAYLKLHLDYENTYSFFTGLITEIKMTEGFDEESRIAIIGKTDKLVSSFDELESLGLTGITVFELDINNTGREKFIQRYCGFDVPFATEEETNWIRNQEAFSQMDVYPYYGSIAKIDNYIVVKMEE